MRASIPRVRAPRIVAGVLLGLLLAGCGAGVDPGEALARGLREREAGNLEAAREAYLQVLEVEPRNRVALHDLGTVEEALGRPAAAEGLYREALDVDPRMEEALLDLARIRARAGATQEAIDLYRRVIQVSPENATARRDLARLLRQIEPWDQPPRA